MRKQEASKVEVTIEEMWNLFIAQHRCCALTGIELDFAPDVDTPQRSICQTASLDRINSSLGYCKNNVQWIHKDLQTMKMDMDENLFDLWCERRTDFLRNRNARTSVVQ